MPGLQKAQHPFCISKTDVLYLPGGKACLLHGGCQPGHFFAAVQFQKTTHAVEIRSEGGALPAAGMDNVADVADYGFYGAFPVS